MANVKISELTETTSVANSDMLVVDDGSATKKVQKQNLYSFKTIDNQSIQGSGNLATKLNMTLLWTNASPTNAFAGQTISLDLSDYLIIVVEVNAYGNNNVFYKQMFFGFINENMVMSSNPLSSTSSLSRTCAISPSGITFSDGSFGSSTNNGAIIPYQIYGII